MSKDLDIKDAYALSPMQEGMLFHYMMDKTSTAYFEQLDLSLQREVERNLVEESFNQLIEKYDIFRTVFIYEKVKKPRQVVLKKKRLKIYFKDISHLSEHDSIDFMENFKKDDKRKGFNLVNDIPMRISLIKMAAGHYRLIWSFHHIIMDGWCLGIVLKEFLQVYSVMEKGGIIRLPLATPYSDYIKWLEKQDKTKGLKFWEKYLEGYNKKASLPRHGNPSQGRTVGKYHQQEYITQIPTATSEALREAAKSNQVTLNTLFQAFWGILLQRYNNTNDVVFGAVVSGRPSEIKGIEKMVGLFINTIPVRIYSGPLNESSNTISQLLKKRQMETVWAKPYEYLPLVEIQDLSLLKGDLIDNIIVFENYPIQEQITEAGNLSEYKIPFGDIGFFEQVNYDFNIIVSPGKKLLVRLNYNSLVYKPEFVKRVWSHFMEIAHQVIENFDIKLPDIKLSNRLLTAELNHLDQYKRDFAF